MKNVRKLFEIRQKNKSDYEKKSVQLFIEKQNSFRIFFPINNSISLTVETPLNYI